MKKLMFVLMLLLGCYDCKKDNSFDNSLNLIGEWSWIRTCVGTGTACWTPATTHTSGRITFTSDSTYNLYQNDTLMFSTKFHTYSTISEDGKYTTHIIKYDSGFWGMYSLSHDTLSVIDEGGITFFTSSYKRIK